MRSREGREDPTSSRRDSELDEEIEFHIEGRARELIDRGWSEADAHAEARRRFGEVERVREELERIASASRRGRRRMQLFEVVRSDVRVALRALRRNPGFGAIAVLTLALGIGATTTIFSVVDGVLLRPLRVPDPERLVFIFEVHPERSIGEEGASGPNFMDWRETAESFSGMAALRYESATLTGVESPQVLTGAGITANLFDVLGVRPLIGRGFRTGEDEGEGASVVVLGYGAWQRLFGGVPDVLGRTLTLDGEPYEIVGVMSSDLPFPEAPDLWRPADMRRMSATAGLEPGLEESRQARYLTVLARLAPGVTLARAQDEMNAISATLAQRYPVDNEGWQTRLVVARDVLVRDVRPTLLLVFGAVGFVLLMACANVANLMLGRALAREPEMALRAALGAGRSRLHMQMLTESVVLASVGGVLGVLLAVGGVNVLVRTMSSALPRAHEIGVDGRVLAFALTACLLTGLLFGIAPSLRAGRTAAAGVLRGAGRGGTAGRYGTTTRRVLIVAEVSLALLLLVGAGLTLRSLQRLLAVDPGYVTHDVIAARVSLDGERYRGNSPKVQYFQELVDRIAALPGVRHAAVTSTLPLTPAGIDFDLVYHAEGQPEVDPRSGPTVDYRVISPGYLATMGIPLRGGRDFTEYDRLEDATGAGGHRVMLVNEGFAQRHWPGESAVGKRVRLYYVQQEPWEVIGVVGDTRHTGIASAARPQVFVPLAQTELLFGYMTIVVRTAPGATGLERQLRETAIALDPNEPLHQIERIETLRSSVTARDRMTAAVFMVFALLAITLAAAGIYAVIAYQVARRTREIGVRIALGAGRGRVVRDVVAEAARLALVGIAFGMVGALIGARFAAALLYGIRPWDPVTFLAVPALLMTVALAAACAPAARAAAIQPVDALRAD